jgi:hypothetical protein
MNERIRELMKQAGTDTSGKWMGVEHAEKFAQLIVQECIEICNNTTGTSYLNGWYAGKQIRKHFGVEE